MKKKIYFWAPFLNKVGTTKSTLNSAISLSKFSDKYDIKIINVLESGMIIAKFLKKIKLKK